MKKCLLVLIFLFLSAIITPAVFAADFAYCIGGSHGGTWTALNCFVQIKHKERKSLKETSVGEMYSAGWRLISAIPDSGSFISERFAINEVTYYFEKSNER